MTVYWGIMSEYLNANSIEQQCHNEDTVMSEYLNKG